MKNWFHKHRNLLLFIIITFFRSGLLVMMKFFLWEYLKDNRTLEEIAGYMSLGSTLCFLVGGSLAYVYKKKYLALGAAAISIILLLIGHYYTFTPYRIFALLVTSLGGFFGLWLIVKGIFISEEILHSGYSETTVNAMLNISLLVGILVGSYGGLASYTTRGEHGMWAIIACFILTIILTIFLKYDTKPQHHSIRQSLKINIPQIITVTKKYFRLLVPIGILRATSTAIGQKMLEIGIDYFNKSPKKTIWIIVLSMIGAIIGHIISIGYKRKKHLANILFTFAFGISVMAFPHFLDNHWHYSVLTSYSLFLGIFLGIIVNILEARYYHSIGNENKEEYGSAAYGIITNIIMFTIMISISYIERKYAPYTFAFLGLAILSSLILTKKVQ